MSKVQKTFTFEKQHIKLSITEVFRHREKPSEKTAGGQRETEKNCVGVSVYKSHKQYFYALTATAFSDTPTDERLGSETI